MTAPFSFSCDKLSGDATVVAFRGHEAISRPYAFDVHVLVGAASATDLDAALGASATLTVDDDAQPVHGVLSEVEFLGRVGDRPLLRVALVPRLWLLSQSRHSRAFTGMTIPEIVGAVLAEGGLEGDAVAMELEATYPERDLVCQVRESDLTFVSRWMEREGLYFFFQQGDGAEKLVITDSRACHEASTQDPVRYFGLGGGEGSGPSLRTLSRKRQVRPRKVAVADYDAQHPDAPLAGSAAVVEGPGGPVNLHGLGAKDGDHAAHLATVAAEARRVEQTVLRAEGTTPALRSGSTFTLEDHPDEALNAEYLVTSLEHFGQAADLDAELASALELDDADVYRVEAVAIPAGLQYRAPQTTPWPRLRGLESAVVDGPADGDAAQMDEHGRYKLKLRFDESDLEGGEASAWVRMAQPYAGAPEGFHFPLRKGTEVLLRFMGGDPDQPVISGAVPNAVTPSPVTAQHAPTNVIHTAGDNHFELHDADGAQFAHIGTPTQRTFLRLGAMGDSHGEGHEGGSLGPAIPGVVLSTEGDKTSETEGHGHEVIRGDKKETIYGSEESQTYGGRAELVMGGDAAVIVGGVTDNVVGFDDSNVVGGSVKVVVGMTPIASQINIIGFDNTNILGGAAENILGAEMKFVGGAVNVVVAGVTNKAVLGGVVSFVGGAVSETILGVENKNVLGGAIETLVGVEMNTKVAGVLDTIVGVDMNTIIGAETKLALGAVMDTTLGLKMDIALASAEDHLIDLKDELIVLKKVAVALKDREIKLDNYGIVLRF